MKTKVYLRVAKSNHGKPKVSASSKPNRAPFIGTAGREKDRALPTVFFALEVNIDDAAFEQASKVLATIDIDEPEIAVEVNQ